MSTQVQYRRGSNVQVAAFTGALGEIVVDTTNKVLVVNDGSTAGGFPQVGLTATQTITNKIYNGTSMSVTGNVTGNYFFGNGSQLTGIDATQITSGTSNVKVVSSGGNISVGVGGTAIVTFTTAGITNDMGNGVGNIGNATGYFNTVFAKATSAQYADLAEMYVADGDYLAGTVIEFGGTHEVTISTVSHSPCVAGVVSTRPSYLMNATQAGDHVIAIALVGRVPCNVIGPISKGDRLVASSIAGVAKRLDMNQYQPGCIIGKALQDYDSEQIGSIEIAVGRF